MKIAKHASWLRILLLAPALLLTGCSNLSGHFWLFNTKGPLAASSLHYMILDVLVMLIIIIPALMLLVWTVWRYRRKRRGSATYSPGWSHSNLIEVIVWGIPLIIVGVLVYYSYVGTHAVNPYGPKVLNHPRHTRQASQKGPLRVDVITTDWQWLFVYPSLHIAVSNNLVVPVNRKVRFRLTSASVTNDFYIPQVVGQIYIMPGMRTRQSMLVQSPGKYHGFSAEFSGPGFSWMKYRMHAVSRRHFRKWVAKVRASGQPLSYADFKTFAKPTVNVQGQSQYFNRVDPHLFRQVVENVKAGKLAYDTPMLMSENMHSQLFQSHTN